MNTPELPSWLAECLVSDSALAGAYESAAPALRALCKHALAVQHVFFGEAPDWEEQTLARSAHGFRARSRVWPADWTLVVFDAEYASAPRLLAALMPALLARVPLVLCVCAPVFPARPELLCALELAGQEHIYSLNASQSLHLLRDLSAQPCRGRLALLHYGALSELRVAAGEAGVPCWEERRAPSLRICRPGPNADLVKLAHPDAWDADGIVPDAVYCDRTDAAHDRVPLVFSSGMEGCWLHPSLTPDFFRERTLTFDAFPPGRENGQIS